MTVYYRNPRPNLTIEHLGSQKLGNCYEASFWRLTSKMNRLTQNQIAALKTAGLITCGQDLLIRSQCDGKEQPAGFDEAPPVDCDEAGRPTGNEPRDWQGKILTEPSKQPYYVYECEIRCDSGD